jgi:hypothetical protein
VLDYQDQERQLLLQALLGLSQADHPDVRDSRAVMLEQVRLLGLPWRMRRRLARMIRRPAPTVDLSAALRNERFGEFLLEQVILGALLDGELSERESLFIGNLAGRLGVSPESLAEREARVVDFYQRHKAFLDAFRVSSVVLSYRQRMLARLQRSIADNLGVIVEEIKGTGELAELLYRAGRGEKLGREERARMRRQLLDILKSIPSLAIFSLPGGVVLLPLLFRLLPPGLKPSAFVELQKRQAERKKSQADSESGAGE